MRFVLLAVLCGLSFTSHAEFSGRLRAEGQYFADPQEGEVSREENSLEIQLEEHASLSDSWRVRVEPRLRLSSVPRISDNSIDGDLRDSLTEKKFGSFLRVQAGSFIKTWEGTDGLNPMDIATVRSYRDPLNSENIGSAGLALGGSILESLSWDVLYVPWQTPARLPGNNSPWWPQRTALPLEVDNTQLLVPDSPQYQVMHHETLNRALNDNFGGRLQLHRDQWDFSAAYFQGAAQIPIFQPIVSGNLIQTSPKFIVSMTNPILIRPIEYRRETVAAAAVYTRQSWIFRLAGRYEQPRGDDELVPGWHDQMVGGVERTLTVGNQMLVLLAQMSYEDKAKVTQSVLDSPDPFERALLLGMRLPYSDDLLFYLSGLIDLHKNSSLARFNVQKKIGGHWSVDGTFEWIRGGVDSLLGQWKNQSRGLVGARYQF
jgi:hypothetical protein